MQVGRNEHCPCGSGKKFKRCCLNKQQAMPLSTKLLVGMILIILVSGLVTAVASFIGTDTSADPHQGKVWSEEHQHWH